MQANVRAHVRRGGGPRWQRSQRAAAPSTGEAAVEEVRRLLVARSRRRRPEHDHDQSPSGVVGARHHVETGRTGKARLHAVRAGIAAKQTIVVGYVLPAKLKRADAEEIGMIWKLTQQGPSDGGHVAGRGHMAGLCKTLGLEKGGARRAS